MTLISVLNLRPRSLMLLTMWLPRTPSRGRTPLLLQEVQEARKLLCYTGARGWLRDMRFVLFKFCQFYCLVNFTFYYHELPRISVIQTIQGGSGLDRAFKFDSNLIESSVKLNNLSRCYLSVLISDLRVASSLMNLNNYINVLRILNDENIQ